MKKVKRWRYYCEYCKKSGGSKWHMEQHESFCTANPNRDCKMCNHIENGHADLSEMVAMVKANVRRFDCEIDCDCWDIKEGETEEGVIAKLREMTDCPACILAALRQSGAPFLFRSFDFKAERDALEAEMIHDHETDHHY